MSGRQRDDFFTLIHKALRAGMLIADIEAGRLDWGDPHAVEAFARRWERTAMLLRSHARHEDHHIWPLLEAKIPGSVSELGVGHDPIDAELDALDRLLSSVLAEPSFEGGLTFYRSLNHCVAHALEHFAAEEPAVMEMLWATCTDDELASCRAGFMAEIPRDEAGWTLELILQSSTDDEQRPVVQGLRASMPEEAFAGWLTGAEQMLEEAAVSQLHRLLEEPVAAG